MEPTPVDHDIVIKASELAGLREAAARAAAPVVGPATGGELVEKSETGFLKTEPVVAVGVFQAILGAILVLSKVFNWFNLTEMQEVAVVSQFTVVTTALLAWARARVTPSSKVALTKSDARIIEATIAKTP